MNRRLLTALVIAVVCASAAQAMYFGLGPMLGVPVGLSAKLFTKPSFALDAGLGYSWWHDSSLQVHGDLVFHTVNLTKSKREDGAMAFYIGLGAQARMAGDPKNAVMRAALRMPLGLEYIFPNAPFDLYLEAVPQFNLGTTDQYFAGDAVCGFRYWWAAGSSNW